ncbi:MAG: hypothetical protein ACRDQ4_18655 [Pseudonocardiaceae bacterium]
MGQCQAPGLARPDVDLGEEEFGQCVAPAVGALAVGAYRVGGEGLGGVELVQVAVNPGGPQVGARAFERVAGLPPVVRLGKAAEGLIGSCVS